MSEITSKKDLITLARLDRPYGVQGWFHLSSFCEDSESLFDFEALWLKSRFGLKALDIEAWRPHTAKRKSVSSRGPAAGRGAVQQFVVKLRGIDNREQAADFSRAEIAVERKDLPHPPADEVYIRDLIGLAVFDLEDQRLGTVSDFLETGANDVLVVKADGDSIDDRERLIPYLVGSVIQSVSLPSADDISASDANANTGANANANAKPGIFVDWQSDW